MNLMSVFKETKTAVWLVLAPFTVVVTLLGLHHVWLTFVGYHLVICLVLPLLDSLLSKRIRLWEHLRVVGLRGPRCRAGILAGTSLGLVLGAGTVALFDWWGGSFLAGNQVNDVLASWRVEPDQIILLIVVMVVGNGMAEELFWRGYIHHRLESVRPRRRALGVTALFYASYHIVTIGWFIANCWVIVLFTCVVVAAGLLWGWLREYYGNVWPALLGHVGATAGYMTVYWRWIVNG